MGKRIPPRPTRQQIDAWLPPMKALQDVRDAVQAIRDAMPLGHEDDHPSHDWAVPDNTALCWRCGAREGTAKGFAPCLNPRVVP